MNRNPISVEGSHTLGATAPARPRNHPSAMGKACRSGKILLAIRRAFAYTVSNITATPRPRTRPWHAQPWRFFIALFPGGRHV